MAADNETAPAPLMPGQIFGVPGQTQYTDQFDSTKSLTTTLATSSQTSVNGIQPFKQTDVVFWWELDVTITQTYTAGTSTVTSSPYGPYNWIASLALQIQNQYSSVSYTQPGAGIDAAIFQLIRPMRGTDRRNNLDVNPAGFLSSNGGWANANLPQPTLQTAPAWASTAASATFTLELPGSIFFDVYYDLDAAGNVISPPHRAIVSPQYMAGTVRQVQPQIIYAAGSSSTLDVGPANIGAGTGTFSGSASLTIRRVGLYAGNPAALPVVYAWQYLRTTSQISLAGRSQLPFTAVPTAGQILAVFLRLFDPSANSGLGAAIAMSAITVCQLQYGSGLLYYDDTPKSAQRRFLKMHGFMPPVGCIIWDLALDEYGRVNNYKALNTLNTSGVGVALTFTGAQSSTAYAVMGVEALTYVL